MRSFYMGMMLTYSDTCVGVQLAMNVRAQAQATEYTLEWMKTIDSQTYPGPAATTSPSVGLSFD